MKSFDSSIGSSALLNGDLPITVDNNSNNKLPAKEDPLLSHLFDEQVTNNVKSEKIKKKVSNYIFDILNMFQLLFTIF